MEEFKGTKGEWKLNFEKALYFSIKVEPDLYVEIFDYEDSAPGIIEANAKLIASAPELLEALQFLYDDVESWSSLHNTTKDKIEQAIKKALL